MFYRKENLSSRLLQAVAKMKYHQKNVWKMADGCSLAMFSTMTSRQPSLSYSF
jgi:hypothetical protein